MIVHGVQKALIPAHMNFGKFILQQFMNTKLEGECLEKYDTGEKLTTVEFIQYAVNLSAGLTELGVKRGDIVAVGGEKRITYQPTTLAVIMSGAAYTPFESQIGKAVLKHKLHLSKPNYFICSEFFWKSYGDVIKGLSFIKTIICFDEIEDIKLTVASLMSRRVELESFEPAAVQGHVDVALILYSSGTTGLPKGVELTHLNCIFRSTCHEYKDKTLKTALLLGDWYHSYNIFKTYNFIISEIKVVYAETLEPDIVLQIVQEKQVNLALITPLFVGYLAEEKKVDKYDLSSLIQINTCGSPLPSSYVEIVKKRLTNLKDVLEHYGMTEIGIAASGHWATKGPKARSVGMAAPGATFKIVDTKTRNILGPYQRGEICVRSPTLLKSYFGIDESTYLDEQGFILTGDLGYYDEDRYFYIVDRLKDMICCNGYEVSPMELEAILQQHPAVQEAGAAGRPAGDAGELPAAVVVRRPGHALTEQQLLDYVSKEASPCMQLRGGVKFVSELPRDFQGKLLRRRIRETLQDIV